MGNYVTREDKLREYYRKQDEKEKAQWKKEHCTSKEEYAKYLIDPKWLNRRNYIFGLRGEVCMHCGKTHLLQVHHIRYTGKYPWLAPDDDLICLCNNCHKEAHNGSLDCDKIISEYNDKEDNKDIVLCFKGQNFLQELSAEDAISQYGKGVIKCCEGITKTSAGHIFKYAKVGKIKTEDKEVIAKSKPIKERIRDIVGITQSQLYGLKNKDLVSDYDFEFLDSIYEQKKLSPKQIYVLERISERTMQYKDYVVEEFRFGNLNKIK